MVSSERTSTSSDHLAREASTAPLVAVGPMENRESASDSKHHYEEIDKASKDIRLLKLCPGQWHESIHATVYIVSLEHSPEYEALSYVWGDPTITAPILVDGCKVDVTVNLEAALRHIRSTNASLILWVDYLCINQGDAQEKTHQVGMMGDIYKSCTRCYLWLGCDEEYFRDSHLKRMGRQSCKSNAYYARSDYFCLVDHLADNNHLSESLFLQTSSAWKSFCAISRSEWWERLWTVQEAILPPDALLVFGHSRTSWNRVADAEINTFRHRYRCCSSVFERISQEMAEQLTKSLTRIRQITNPRTTLNTLRYIPAMRDLISSFSDRLCHDPRDRIYGLLGLFDYGVDLGIIPDYTLEPHHIYVSAFQKMAEQRGRDLWTFVGSNFTSANCYLPSWVPDFGIKLDNRTRDADIQRRSHYYLYNASRNKVASLVFLDCSAIRLRGVLADVVSRVKHMLPSNSHEAGIPELLSWSVSVDHEIDPCCDTLWRTLTADVTLNRLTGSGRRLGSSDHELFKSYTRWRSRFGSNPSFLDSTDDVKARIFTDSIYDAVYNRSFFITRNGRLGIGPSGTQPGDHVWVLFGGRVPFVLRPSQNAGHAKSRENTFVGDCYLHGIMDGECLNGNHKTKTVVLR